jgi:hypothetical protein
MDRASAIAINQAALARIVAALIALAGLGDGVAARLPQTLSRAILRVLVPAESAVRRLIVLAACGLDIKLSPTRAMPAGLALARTGGGRLAFQLFDPRKRFVATRRTCAQGGGPQVHLFALDPRVPFFQPRPVENRVIISQSDDEADASRIGRRLVAIKQALDNLPRQARRLKRWQARRLQMPSPKFRSPLRLGLPPGHRKQPQEEIDVVLSKCHALAREAVSEDTS